MARDISGPISFRLNEYCHRILTRHVEYFLQVRNEYDILIHEVILWNIELERSS